MFRGWMALDGVELTNTSRLVAHAQPDVPESMEEALQQCACAHDRVGYDDSWPGLQSFLGDSAYTITSAPWYDPAIPQSSEFLGIWVTNVIGLGPTPVDRTVSDAISAGGIAGPHRDRARQVTVEATLMGCTNAGVEYGLHWLSCRMLPATAQGGTTLEFLAAHPEDSAASPALLQRTAHRVVLTREITETKSFGTRGQQHRQGALKAVDWEMQVLDPYLYGPPTTQTVTWASTVTEQITWAHPPDCEDPESCTDIPVLASATCIPTTIDVSPVQPPVCAGCIPVCQVQTRVAAVPTAVGVLCRDQAVTLTITAAELTSANFWFRPCGAEDLCDRTGFLSIAGLPAGGTVVADSVLGRPYGVVGGQRVRQVGIVGTPSGAPWTPVLLDASECWELVAQHEPGLDFTVTMQVQGRQA